MKPSQKELTDFDFERGIPRNDPMTGTLEWKKASKGDELGRKVLQLEAQIGELKNECREWEKPESDSKARLGKDRKFEVKLDRALTLSQETSEVSRSSLSNGDLVTHIDFDRRVSTSKEKSVPNTVESPTAAQQECPLCVTQSGRAR